MNLTVASSPLLGQSAGGIADGALEGQAWVSESFDQMWQDLLVGGGGGGSSSPLYGAIADVGVMLAAVAILFWTVQWAKAMMDDGRMGHHLAQITWPLIVAILLSNNGALMAQSTIGLRNIINEVNAQVLEDTSSSTSLVTARKEAMQQVQEAKTQAAQAHSCSGIPPGPALRGCMQRQNTEETGDWLENLSNNLSAGLLAGLQGTLEFILWTMGIAYQWGLEIALLLAALLGPLALGFTLFPSSSGRKALIAWLVAFIAIGLAKLFFNITVGLVSMLMLNTQQGDVISMIFSFVSGLFAPVLATMVAKGGGQALYNSLGTTAPAGGLGAQVGGAVAGVTTAAATGAALATGGAAAGVAGTVGKKALAGAGKVGKAALKKAGDSIGEGYR